MYQRVLAFDFDGTLADENGVVPPALQVALETLHAAGYALFLVTGRRFGNVELGALKSLFAGIAWENGAVLHHLATDAVYLPFGQLDPQLVGALERGGVPLEKGRAIVSIAAEHDTAVWRILNDWGRDATLAPNKGVLRIVPPGASKGAGLERLLGLCGFSPRNLVSFGDGQSDLSMLKLGEIRATVADAMPCVRELADVVATHPGPAGVLETLEAYWLGDCTGDLPARHERPIPLGRDEAGDDVSMPAARLVGGNLGVFGDSGSGKSWVAGLLVEGMYAAGYQVLIIDPEGDFRGMRALPGVISLEVSPDATPPPTMISALLETVTASIVLDMSAHPATQRISYVADLVRALLSLKSRKFRPHWIVMEEAQYFLPSNRSEMSVMLPEMLADGGWAFISYCPDRLSEEVLRALDACILTRLSDPDAIQALQYTAGQVPRVSLAKIPQGYAWLCGEQTVRLRPNVRRVSHIRHLYKYLDTPLPRHKRFYFRDEKAYLGVEAATLYEFLHCLRTLPIESLAYHQVRGDFAAWVKGALGYNALSDHLRKLAQRQLTGEALRDALVQRVASHYEELCALR
ncbi:MAG: HAD hydrolase family protein [Anaerolineae bacterium]|nr:HAD hydrolase family protein [Anaerolineae bacterium]